MQFIIGFGGNALVYGGNYIGEPPLQPKRMRILFTDPTVDMTAEPWASWWSTHFPTAVWTRIYTNPNLWDFYYDSSDWRNVMIGDDPTLPLPSPSSPFGSTSGIQGEMQILDANLYGVTSLTSAFRWNTKLTAVNIPNAPTLRTMDYCFAGARNLSNVSTIDTSAVTNMDGAFIGCAFTTVPLFDTSSVTTMFDMFRGCTALTTVPLFDTSSAEDMGYMLAGCTALTTVPLFDTSSLIDMSYMFFGCTSLTTVPLFDTSSVVQMQEMFRGCTSLTKVPLFSTANVQTINDAFRDCRNVDDGSLALYNQLISQQTPPYEYTRCFLNCGIDTPTGLQQLNQIPSSWGGLGN